MAAKQLVYGPTFEEMLHPGKIRKDVRAKALETARTDPLSEYNLFNITWRNPEGNIYYTVLPKELTGVDANIAVIYSKDFPTRSHKVGATYSICMEHQLRGEIEPGKHTLVWPSTGNYGIGGAYVGPRMGFDSMVILPELMSRERFEQIEWFGARYIKTPGCESNVKEIYDRANELREDPKNRILNQFEEFGNYRFHYYCTGNSCIEVADELKERGIGDGTISAFVSAMGSAGTIAAGERIKHEYRDALTIGVEPIQCPTIYWNGYGGHDIQGIGDKHVTWIHNVFAMDAIMCVDDIESKKGLQLLTEEAGWKVLSDRYGVPEESIRELNEIMGISGVCNVLASIKTAKFYRMGADKTIFTVATDTMDRYRSVMEEFSKTYGPMDEMEAMARMASIFHGVKLDWIREGTQHAKQCWFNLKYYTWVEQQGKTVEELDAQRDPAYWVAQQAKVEETDRLLREARGW
ncbi:MAG: pyridoxal-phosphate dependent enzyme [Candidatus Eisenbacteria bacterium]|nr:pyridoxal-phosphate dependent enzyme [Candidatus Eisenbacteria bacterium]